MAYGRADLIRPVHVSAFVCGRSHLSPAARHLARDLTTMSARIFNRRRLGFAFKACPAGADVWSTAEATDGADDCTLFLARACMFTVDPSYIPTIVNVAVVSHPATLVYTPAGVCPEDFSPHHKSIIPPPVLTQRTRNRQAQVGVAT